MGELYTRIGNYMKKQKVEISGMPLTVYYGAETENIEMECGIPVEGSVNGTNEIAFKSIPAGKVVMGIHKGDYSGLAQSHEELMRYLRNNSLETNGNPWEIYITDPGQVPDTAAWITHVYYPVGG